MNWRQSLRGKQGFTMVELVVILLIVGILAAAMIPRFANRQVFDARGFYDATLSALSYAHKSAIAQRRNVCVTFNGNNSLSLGISAVFNGACALGLSGPDGSSPPYTISAAQGTSFVGQPVNFIFLSSGAVAGGGSQSIRVNGMPGVRITIDAVSGNVYSEPDN